VWKIFNRNARITINQNLYINTNHDKNNRIQNISGSKLDNTFTELVCVCFR